MNKNLQPLHYAIIKHFDSGLEDSADGVMAALEQDYAGYKLLNLKDIEETLSTAKENGLLEEATCQLDDIGNLVLRYRLTPFGKDMIRRYL